MNTPQFASNSIVQRMTKIGNELSEDEFTKIGDAAKKAFDNSGLKDKGVSIIKACEENADEIKEAVNLEFDKNIVQKFLPKKMREFMANSTSQTLIGGKNACYLSRAKKIAFPQDGALLTSAFHETGHALNANMSKVGSLLQKARPLSALALPILLTTLIRDKKQEGEEPTGMLDKAGDFVKNNAGKLAFLSFAPVLIEEGLASIKGNKMARELLDPSLAKKIAKTNALGYSSYVIAALGTGLGVHIAGKVRDSIVNPEDKKAKTI